MAKLAILLLQLLVSPYLKDHAPAPDCQRFCLGECHWDWDQRRCMDTRVVFIGTWDPIPLDYEPPTESQFPVWKLAYPKDWGEYPLEQPRPPDPEAETAYTPPEVPRQEQIRRAMTPLPLEGP